MIDCIYNGLTMGISLGKKNLVTVQTRLFTYQTTQAKPRKRRPKMISTNVWFGQKLVLLGLPCYLVPTSNKCWFCHSISVPAFQCFPFEISTIYDFTRFVESSSTLSSQLFNPEQQGHKISRRSVVPLLTNLKIWERTNRYKPL